MLFNVLIFAWSKICCILYTEVFPSAGMTVLGKIVSQTKQTRNKHPNYFHFTPAVSCSQTMEGTETGEVS
jgi:hypothetical protein